MSETTYRTVSRRVTFVIELSGDPITWQYPSDGARLVQVERVDLRFDHGDNGYSMDAYAYGQCLHRGKYTKIRGDHLCMGDVELWPAWLTELAELHRPEAYAVFTGLLADGGAR